MGIQDEDMNSRQENSRDIPQAKVTIEKETNKNNLESFGRSSR